MATESSVDTRAFLKQINVIDYKDSISIDIVTKISPLSRELLVEEQESFSNFLFLVSPKGVHFTVEHFKPTVTFFDINPTMILIIISSGCFFLWLIL